MCSVTVGPTCALPSYVTVIAAASQAAPWRAPPLRRQPTSTSARRPSSQTGLQRPRSRAAQRAWAPPTIALVQRMARPNSTQRAVRLWLPQVQPQDLDRSNDTQWAIDCRRGHGMVTIRTEPMNGHRATGLGALGVPGDTLPTHALACNDFAGPVSGLTQYWMIRTNLDKSPSTGRPPESRGRKFQKVARK
jgi:hypothetical protein